MQKNTIIGMITGFVLLIVFILGLGMEQQEPIYQWLFNSFNGIAFMFAFGFGVPAILSYILTLFLFGIIYLIGFFIGKKMAGLPKKSTNDSNHSTSK